MVADIVFGVSVLLMASVERASSGCLLPEHPLNGRHIPFSLDCPSDQSESAECRGVPGSPVGDNWVLLVQCDPGFKPDDPAKHNIPTVCAEGVWVPALPTCVFDLSNVPNKCTLPDQPENGKYEVMDVECAINPGVTPSTGDPVPPACVLLYSCNQEYQLTSQQEQLISICDNGAWSPRPDKVTCERANKIPPNNTPSRNNTNQVSMSDGCILPGDEGNRVYCSFYCEDCGSVSCRFKAGSRVLDQAIRVQCDRGYRLSNGQDYMAVVCVQDSWTPRIQECLKECPALESDSVYPQCTYGTTQVDCSKPMLPTTTAVYQCRPSHTEYPSLTQAGVYRRTLTCRANGRWSYDLPECKPACGVSKGDAQITPTIVGGRDAKLGVFPWHAGLYQRSIGIGIKEKWRHICGGSLISKTVVLTAHCVVLLNESDLQVGLGKYYRTWSTDEPYAVKRGVSAIRIPHEFSGSVTTYAWDIALLHLSEAIQINSFVMPVCQDIGMTFNISVNITGYVVGWGKTAADENESEILLHNDVTIMDNAVCRRKIPRILAFDKFCAEKYSKSVAEKGDSGGGITATFNGLHYILGIVSFKYNNVSVFTNVSWETHKRWIENQLIELNV